MAPVSVPRLIGAVTAPATGRRSDAERQGITVDARLEEARTAGDRRLVERLVTNLVDNAIRYNLTGGRTVVTVESCAAGAVLRVSNTGPVVGRSELERLFEPFRRIGGDRTRHREGTGLGLSIVKAIADAHQAAVDVQARSAGGLDVEVRFPGPGS